MFLLDLIKKKITGGTLIFCNRLPFQLLACVIERWKQCTRLTLITLTNCKGEYKQQLVMELNAVMNLCFRRVIFCFISVFYLTVVYDELHSYVSFLVPATYFNLLLRVLGWRLKIGIPFSII